MPEYAVTAVRTDAGMPALWCTDAFRGIDGYESWEARVDERLDDVISAGELVPVNIGSDGAFGVRLVLAPDALTERELNYAVVTSAPYLLDVTGGEVCISGLEGVGDPARAAARVPLADGHYAVRTTLVAWDEEPGARGQDGMPSDGALADYVLLIAPEQGTETYRTNEETFDPPE